jgi:glutamyl-tRNA synthetase
MDEWPLYPHIRKLPELDLAQRIRPFLESAGLKVADDKLMRIIKPIQPRLELLPDAIALVEFLFKDHIDRDLEAMLKKGMDAARARGICIAAAERQVAEEFGGKSGPIFAVIRIAITGKTVTPPLFESIFALGQAQSVQRLKETAGLLHTLPPASQ